MISHMCFALNSNKFNYWYFGKHLSELMASPKRNQVIRVNDNCGLISDKKFAYKHAHMNLEYYYNILMRNLGDNR